MDPAKYAELFLEETREHLNNINQQLLEWERQPDATEPVAAIFRSVHNIKGMAATMGYASVATLAHRVENVLDLLRAQGGTVQPDLLDLFFRSADTLEQTVAEVVQGQDGATDVSDLVAELDQAAASITPKKTGKRAEPRPSSPMVEVPARGGTGIRVQIRPDAPLKGARGLIVLRTLESFGRVFGVEPALSVVESDAFEGLLRCRIETDASHEDLRKAVLAVGDVSDVSVGVEGGDEGGGAQPVAGQARHVRVDLRRLDNLMNLIGELVTARGRLVELSAERADPDLEDVSIKISHLTSSLQGEIITARMTPGWQVFDRFPRLVRDIARKLDKKVHFEIEGKEIELDKALLDELGDPLMHLLRNAVDHGIETPAERRAAGKPEEGKLTLSALRERATVVIRVSDDGRGIPRERVLADAIERGLVAPETETLPDDVLLEVVARPGFSTAASVSDVSGRGVGIDVVMNRLRSFGGSLDLKTEVGVGTAFTLRLPPTLAIVPALLAQVGGERYALPLTHVEETVDLDARAVTEIDGGGTLLVRDEVIPLVSLRELVSIEGDPPAHRPVIILQIGDRRSGLVVDALGGQREIVVKSFDPPKGTVPIFSGVTVLGDGTPVFILDAVRLV